MLEKRVLCSRVEWPAGKVSSDFIKSTLGTPPLCVQKRKLFGFLLRVVLSQKTIISLQVNLPEAYPHGSTIETYFASSVTITFLLK